MIYILKGQEEYFINQKLNELIKGFDNVIKYDGSSKDFNLDEMLDSCTSVGLFQDKNVVLVKDPFFLCKKVDDILCDKVLNYINDPLYETDLIFYSYTNSLNSKLKLFKDVSKNANILSFDNYDYKQFNNFVSLQVNKAKLDTDNRTVNYLAQICKRDATLFMQNLSILKLYPGKINDEAINKLCTFSDDNLSFDLINAIVNKDISLAIKLERRLLSDSDSALSLIGLLANQLRFLYQISYFQSQNKKKNEIINILNCNEYRYDKAYQTLSKLKSNAILSLLNKLHELDLKCKYDDSISDNDRFELFILGILQK